MTMHTMLREINEAAFAIQQKMSRDIGSIYSHYKRLDTTPSPMVRELTYRVLISMASVSTDWGM